MKTVRLPGGLSISLSGLYTSESYHRAMDQIGVVTAPLKAVLDILTFALGIKHVLDAAADIPTDPTEFKSRLREVTASATRLASMIPQVSVPVLVRDICAALVDVLQLVRDEIAAAQELAQRKTNVQAAVELDPALEEVVVRITAQETRARAGLAEMLEPFMLVGGIVDAFLELIGRPPLGLTAGAMEDLGALDSLLAGIQDVLRNIALGE